MTTPVTLTENAAKRILHVLATEKDARLLRLAVNGGGCSGFQYEFGLVAAPEADDLIVERDGATLAVDSAALDLIAGSQVDFIDSLIGASFQVQNPNAKSSCGCGESFSI
ncbi:MAG: iron-sulfur cluster assembly accessory protein [Caulobacterales bacterium]